MRKISSIVIYTTNWCGDCFRVKAFFDEHNIEYKEIDIEKDSNAAQKVEQINNGMRSVPTIIFGFQDGSIKILVEPKWEELNEFFNIDKK